MATTYKIDRKKLTIEKLQYDKRNNTSIWIGGKRRDTSTPNNRYSYLDDIWEAQNQLETAMYEQRAEEVNIVNEKYRKIESDLQHRIAQLKNTKVRL